MAGTTQVDDVLVGYLTGEVPGETGPKPACNYTEMQTRWAAEPMPTDDFAKREVAERRIAESTACLAQWGIWSSLSESEVG